MYVGLPNPNVLVPLKKLHIHKVNPSTPDPYQNNDFDVLYNPESYVQKREVQYSEKTGLSMDSPITQFAHGNAETLTFSLFFDSMSSGSEVGGSIADKAKFAGNSMLPSAGKLIDVRTYTQKVYNLMEIDVNLHVPPLLELTWGSLSFTGHLISCQQSFTSSTSWATRFGPGWSVPSGSLSATPAPSPSAPRTPPSTAPSIRGTPCGPCPPGNTGRRAAGGRSPGPMRSKTPVCSAAGKPWSCPPSSDGPGRLKGGGGRWIAAPTHCRRWSASTTTFWPPPWRSGWAGRW